MIYKRSKLNKQMEVLIAGYYGYHNIGDEAILNVLLDDLKSISPNLSVTITSDKTRRKNETSHYDTVASYDIRNIIYIAKRSDLILLGGGGIFNDYWDTNPRGYILSDRQVGLSFYYSFPFLAGLFQKPCMAYGIGIGPLSKIENSDFAKEALQYCSSITVRDKNSYALLNQLGIKSLLTADPAFRLKADKQWAATELNKIISDFKLKPLIGISVRNWDQSDDNWKCELANSLSQFTRVNDVNILFIPFQMNEGNIQTIDDVQASKSVIDLLEDKNRVYILEKEYSPTEISGIIACCHLLVGMRYHSVVFSLTNNIPCIALSYDPKVSSLMEESDLSDYCCDVNFISQNKITELLNYVLLNQEVMQKKIKSISESMIQRSRSNIPILKNTINKGFSGNTPDQKLIDLLLIQQSCHLGDRALEIRDLYYDRLLPLQDRFNKAKMDMENLNKKNLELVSQINRITRNPIVKMIYYLHMLRYRLWNRKPVRFIMKATKKILKRIYSIEKKTISMLVLFVVKMNWPFFPKKVKEFIRAYRNEKKFVDRSNVYYYHTEKKLTLIDYPKVRLIPNDYSYKKRFSLIVTTYNEEKTIDSWLEALLRQTRLPDEIVLVDAGSKDKTVDIINQIKDKIPVPFILKVIPNLNIAEGRNQAIKLTTNEIIACTDLGTIMDEHFLEYLLYPFESDNISVSCGYYDLLQRDNSYDVVQSLFAPDAKSIDPQRFLPSSRSVAFTKSIWERVGGYPEWLTDAGEDTLFDLTLKMIQADWAFVPEAIVYWQAPENIKKIYKTVLRYAKGDGESGIFASQYWDTLLKAMEILIILLLMLISILVIPISPIFGIIFGGLFLFLTFLGLIKVFLQLPPEKRKTKIILFLFLSHIVIIFSKVKGFIVGVKNRKEVNTKKAAYFRRELNKIIEERRNDVKGIVLYPPTHDWEFMFQRPQQIARSFVKNGYLYFYCTENQIKDHYMNFTEVEPNLFISPVPLETFSDIQDLILYIGSPWHVEVAKRLPGCKIIYDHYDDIKVSSARKEDHLHLLKISDLVVVTSKGLEEAAKKLRHDLLLVQNGVDFDFVQTQKPKNYDFIPEDLKPILEKKMPIIGYSGALAQWFDYELLGKIAKSLPNFQFVLLGVNYDGSLDKSNLLNNENVHWLGLKQYSQLFKYLWYFDVALIPFKINDITLMTSPIKLFEYFACGLPVISSALPECKQYSEVLIIDGEEEFVEALDRAMKLHNDKNYLKQIETIAKENTWDNRVKSIINRL